MFALILPTLLMVHLATAINATNADGKASYDWNKELAKMQQLGDFPCSGVITITGVTGGKELSKTGELCEFKINEYQHVNVPSTSAVCIDYFSLHYHAGPGSLVLGEHSDIWQGYYTFFQVCGSLHLGDNCEISMADSARFHSGHVGFPETPVDLTTGNNVTISMQEASVWLNYGPVKLQNNIALKMGESARIYFDYKAAVNIADNTTIIQGEESTFSMVS